MLPEADVLPCLLFSPLAEERELTEGFIFFLLEASLHHYDPSPLVGRGRSLRMCFVWVSASSTQSLVHCKSQVVAKQPLSQSAGRKMCQGTRGVTKPSL